MLCSTSPNTTGRSAVKSVGCGQCANHVDKAPREIDSDRRPFAFIDRCNDALNHASQVECNSICGLWCPQARSNYIDANAQTVQLRIKRLGYKDFVETSVEYGHLDDSMALGRKE